MSAFQSPARLRVPRSARSAVERARLTLVPRRAGAAPRGPFVAAVAVVLLVGVVGLLMFNTSMQQASFAATRLEQRAADLHARQQSLQLEIDRLRDPQQVALRAQRLGMVPMVNPAFLRLGADSSVPALDPPPASRLDGQRLLPLPARRPAQLRVRPVRVEAPALTAPEPGQVPDGGTTGVPSDATGAAAGTKTR